MLADMALFPCLEPGGFDVVCSVVAGVGVFVCIISIFCIFHMAKLCVKLRNDKARRRSSYS